jgi:hypothetical protein
MINGIHSIPMGSRLGAFSQPEQLMSGPERELQTGLSSRELVFDHSLAPVRKTERFKKFLRDTGLVDYWRARGWPDLCRPVGADDFECD